MPLSNRKPFSITEAFNRAVMEESDDSDQSHVMDASPSPAPRIARARHEDEDKRMRKILGQDHLDSKAPGPARPFSRGSVASSTFAVARPSIIKPDSPRRRTLYGKASSPELNGAKPDEQPEAGTKDPANSLRPHSGWLRQMPSKDDLTNQGRIPALAPGIEDLPWPSTENGENQPASVSPAKNASPEKSFAWEFDQDFTAGDLQMSDSPRIRMGARPFANRIKFDEASEVDINSRTRVATPGSRNTKLDEIRTREVKAGSNIPIQSPRRQPNTKLAEIQQRESVAEHQIPIPNRSLPRPTNTKLDEIRQREINGISNRTMAKMKLDEIREQNSNSASRSISRSLSPEESRPSSSRAVPPVTEELDDKPPPRPKSAFEVGGQRIPDTPVTIFKAREFKSQAPAEKRDELNQGKENTKIARPEHRRSDSRDLLRQLARATSSSPVPETDRQRPASPLPGDKQTTQEPIIKPAIPRRISEYGTRQTQPDVPKNNERPKPTVGFTGLSHSRARSTDSVKSKRSSMQSEVDPTDRIEAEMSLFALGENQSEKGSTRPPSPQESEDEKEADATPRAPKPDPLSMPTPKVTGAYVETPATVKVEKFEIKDEKPLTEKHTSRVRHSSTTDDKTSEELRRLRAGSSSSTREEKEPEEARPLRPRSSSANKTRKTDLAWQSNEPDTASDPGTDEKSAPTALSTGVRRRRAQSLPRRRGPLRNSAKPPTVKDDLIQLHREHQIEDSTLDDFEEVLSGRKTPSPRMRALLNNLPSDLSADDDFDFELDLDTRLNTKSNKLNNIKDPEHSDGELAAFTRMSKSLQTGLMGIRTAKKGIERLEGQFNYDTKPTETTSTEAISIEKTPTEKTSINMTSIDEKPPTKKMDIETHEIVHTTACTHGPTVTYLQLPIPRLYHRKPSFRFTLLGLILFIFSLWYAAESAMCAKYCRPTTCGKAENCVWSIDDPSFGNAIPIKLDQWVTGGQGRVFLDARKEDFSDWLADVLDVYYDRDITKTDISGFTFHQKRQHRRRLRKKGLQQTPPVSAEHQAKLDAWHQARIAKERVIEAREMGYDVSDEDDEAVGGDQRVW